MSARMRTVRNNLLYAAFFAVFGFLVLAGTIDVGDLTTPFAAITFGLMSINVAVAAYFMWGRR